MQRSYVRWVSACYRSNEPEMAQDASPAKTLDATLRGLARYWQKRFNDAAPKLAKHFSLKASQRSSAGLKSILKDGGFTVQFKMSPELNDVIQATVAENVALIRSLPQQYHTQVQGAVMRTVQSGRSLPSLVKHLEEQHGVTKRRARAIARDQNSKATAAVQNARYTELGITKAQWVHSGAGKHPRPEHVKAGRDKLIFDVRKGALLEGKRTWPGVEINCRCIQRPVMEGLVAA